MRNLNMEIHSQSVGRDQLTPLPLGPHQFRRPCIAVCCCCWSEWPARHRQLLHHRARNGPSPLLAASQEVVTAVNAEINKSGSDECLRGKFSNAILKLSNSCDVSCHSSTACELASELAGQESELSVGEVIATSETLFDLIGDSETSH